MPPILVDTGPLYAAADRDDDWHHWTVRFLETASRRGGDSHIAFADSAAIDMKERLRKRGRP